MGFLSSTGEAALAAGGLCERAAALAPTPMLHEHRLISVAVLVSCSKEKEKRKKPILEVFLLKKERVFWVIQLNQEWV